jgi:hypothetical protein
MAEHTDPLVTVEQLSIWSVSVNGAWIGDVERVEGRYLASRFGADVSGEYPTLDAAVAVLVGAWKERQG